MGLQPLRHLCVRVLGHRGGYAAVHGVGHQVVRKLVAPQHLGGFEFGDGVGQPHGRHLQHVLGQWHAKVHAGDRCHARQGQCTGRQLRHAAFDQARHRNRPRQGQCRARGLKGLATQMAFDPGLLERFQHEQRVAAGALAQPGGQRSTADARQLQGIHQRGQVGFGQGQQRHRAQPGLVGQGVCKGVQRRGRFGRAPGQGPAWAAARRLSGFVTQQGQQHLQAGFVGKVQVVHQQPGQARLSEQQAGERTLQHQALALAGRRGGTTGQLGHHARDFAACGRLIGQQRGGFGHGGHRAQQAGQRGKGHAGIARPRGHMHDAGAWCGKFLQQARLAHAGFADQRHDLGRGPAFGQCLHLRIAAKQPRRAQHAGWHAGQWRWWRGRAAAAFQRGQQGQRGGGRPRADFVLQQLFAAVKGQQGGGAVTRQVVQAHQALVRFFG